MGQCAIHFVRQFDCLFVFASTSPVHFLLLYLYCLFFLLNYQVFSINFASNFVSFSIFISVFLFLFSFLSVELRSFKIMSQGFLYYWQLRWKSVIMIIFENVKIPFVTQFVSKISFVASLFWRADSHCICVMFLPNHNRNESTNIKYTQFKLIHTLLHLI